MANLWLELAYSHISPKAHDEIYKKIARKSLLDWMDEQSFRWEGGGWTAMELLIEEFIRTNKYYEQIAAPTGNERYFQIAQKVGLELLLDVLAKTLDEMKAERINTLT